MSFWRVVRETLLRPADRWNPHDDDTVRFLREQRAAALRETRRLRRGLSWEDLYRSAKGSGDG